MSEIAVEETAYPVAGLLRRIAALGYDALLVVALWMVVGGIGVALNGNEVITGPARVVLLFACLATTFAFFAKFWRDGGQTAGMRAWRIKIVNQLDPASRVTLTQCLLRFVTAIAALGLGGLGYLWILVDREHLSWHDRYSSTRLIVLPKPPGRRRKRRTPAPPA